VPVRERWFADGYEFTDGDVRDVEYRTGLLGTPEMRGDNGVIPNRTGELWRPKHDGPGSFTLAIWLAGGSQAEAAAAWDTVLRAVRQRRRLVTWQRITPDGETRQCQGEIVGSMQPTALGQIGYRAGLEVRVPAAYWFGTTLFTYSTPTGTGVTQRDLDLPGFAGCTAPLEGLTYKLDGQLVRPKLTDITTFGAGDNVLYDATIADGTSATLDSSTWGITGGGGHVADGQKLTYPAVAVPGASQDRFLALEPLHPSATTHRVRLSADTIGTNGKLTVSGYRAYLC
jgi:hypothetical protein